MAGPELAAAIPLMAAGGTTAAEAAGGGILGTLLAGLPAAAPPLAAAATPMGASLLAGIPAAAASAAPLAASAGSAGAGISPGLMPTIPTGSAPFGNPYAAPQISGLPMTAGVGKTPMDLKTMLLLKGALQGQQEGLMQDRQPPPTPQRSQQVQRQMVPQPQALAQAIQELLKRSNLSQVLGGAR